MELVRLGDEEAHDPALTGGKAAALSRLAASFRVPPGFVLTTESFERSGEAPAVVTDSGGILSHCAIVAREYAIPAVVRVGMGTAVIQDGQLVEVDGDAGVVRIIAE